MAPESSLSSSDAESLSDTLYQQIRDRICLLEYPPGTVLKEGALAEEFDVSRTPIRHVLHRLEFDGLVSITPRSGAVVTVVDIKSLKEVYALRLKLAELVGELSTNRITPELLDALAALHAECEQMVTDYDPVALARLYNRFHEAMLGVIANRPLREVTDRLFHQTSRVWLQILPDLDWQDEVETICAEITEVMDALRAGDVREMAQVRRNHMAMLLRRMNDYLSGADPG